MITEEPNVVKDTDYLDSEKFGKSDNKDMMTSQDVARQGDQVVVADVWSASGAESKATNNQDGAGLQSEEFHLESNRL